MTKSNILADALRTISNGERCGKTHVLIRPSSKIIIKFLQVMQRHGYIDKFTFIDDARSGKIIVTLIGRINKCRAISPRYDLKIKDSEKWINSILPSRQFGIIVLSTSLGILDHKEAFQKKTGGKILGFFY
jgi:small subunit ribosomal protein S15Ae